MKHEPRTPFGSSMRPSLRQRMVAYCQGRGLKVWSFVEQAVIEKLDRCAKEVEHG